VNKHLQFVLWLLLFPALVWAAGTGNDSTAVTQLNFGGTVVTVTRAGNTGTLATTTGSLPSGNLASYDASGNLKDSGTAPILSGISGSIGGGVLTAGTCSSGTASVTGATTSMVAEADPNTYPGDGIIWDAQVTAGGTVTVKVCAIVALTPTSSTYNIRVLQ